MLRVGDFENLWIWNRVRDRLPWYYAVSTNRMPAKYLIARRVPCDVDLEADEEALWSAHDRATERFLETWSAIRQGRKALADFEVQEPSLVDLSVAIVLRMLTHCNFCQWRCNVNRVEGKKYGTCQLDTASRVGSYFHHPGEELVFRGTRGSGTIFFTSCNLRCRFCLSRASHVLTDRGPRSIEELYNAAGFEVDHGEGQVRFPSDLHTFSDDGRRVRVSKLFRHLYEGDLVEIKPLNAPLIRVTPEHEMVAANGPDGLLRKIRAGDLTSAHYLAIPRVSYPVLEVEVLDVASLLGPLAEDLTFEIGRRPQRPQLLRAIELSRNGASSREIGEEFGYHPTYVRSLLGRIRKEGLPEPERPNGLVVEGGTVRLKTEKRPGIPVQLPIDKDLAEFLGYYCADGHVTKGRGRPSSYKVVLSFGRMETRLVQRTVQLVRNLFHLEPKVVWRRTTATVEAGKSSLGLLLKALCGGRAREKRAPDFLFGASPEVVESFLEAFAAGDGCESRGYLSLSTVSKRLGMGLFALHLRLGRVPAFNRNRRPSTTVIEGRRVRQSTLYTVNLSLNRMKAGSGETAKGARYRFRDNHILVPIHRIDRAPHKGPVYNLEVEDPSHTFTANFLAVGNCQNANISEDRWNGIPVTPEQLAAAAWQLRMEGCHNVNWVGGDPTIHLHTIVQAIAILARGEVDTSHFLYLQHAKSDLRRYWIREEYGRYGGEFNVPMLWNSNFFMSEETMRILRPLIDVWLPDFKFGNKKCAVFLSYTPWYVETVARNHKLVYDWGEDMVIRHLVMPDHVECCTKPVLGWIRENTPEALINVMDQYHPDYACDPASAAFDPKYRELARRPLEEEIRQAYVIARDLDLRFEDVTFEKARVLP